MPTIIVTIPGVPIAQKRPRFARRGKFFTTYSDQATEAGRFLILAQQQIKEKAPRGVPVSLRCVFVFPIPKSTTKRALREMREVGFVHIKKPDASNCLKFVEDCLNGIAWHDDSQIWKTDTEKLYGTEPETEIMIAWNDGPINLPAIPGVKVRVGNVGDL